jgi:hypothetical protein
MQGCRRNGGLGADRGNGRKENATREIFHSRIRKGCWTTLRRRPLRQHRRRNRLSSLPQGPVADGELRRGGTVRHLRNIRGPARERVGKAEKKSCKVCRFAYVSACPISHVPVVVCRLAGIRTRGRLTARKTRQPEANRRTPPNGGRDLKQRRTGLFRLCQIQPGVPKRLVYLAGRAEGTQSLSKRRPLQSRRHIRLPGLTCPTAQHPIVGHVADMFSGAIDGHRWRVN